MVTPSQELTNSTSESGNAATIAIPEEGDCKKPEESLIAHVIDNDEMAMPRPNKEMTISSLEDEEEATTTASENDGEMATPSQELTSSSLESGIDETVAIPEENHGRKPKKSLISLEAAWAAAWPETMIGTLSEDSQETWPETVEETGHVDVPEAWADSGKNKNPCKKITTINMVLVVGFVTIVSLSLSAAGSYLLMPSSSSESQNCKCCARHSEF